MQMSDFVIKSGDTSPSLIVTLVDDTETPVNLNGANVAIRMRAVEGGALVIDAPADVIGDPRDGVVSYDWQPSDTDDVGRFEVEFEVTYISGDPQTFPNEGYVTVEIRPSLSNEIDALPPLPDYCWPVDHGCCSEFDEYPVDIQARADSLASQTMRMLTGYSVGGCPVTLRPCSINCVSSSGGWYAQGGTFRPFIDAFGSWVNGCGCNYNTCGCNALPSVGLGGVSGSRVIEVKVDGVILSPTTYAVHNGNTLVRTDGLAWPVCQDMAKADTEVGTFSVRVSRGQAVDRLGAYAAGVLACEYAKACSGKKCSLPAGTTNVVRQGISVTLVNDLFPGGLTGIREVDLIIARYNPNHLRLPAMVYSPDVSGAVIVT
jgi:hypothetical protein